MDAPFPETLVADWQKFLADDKLDPPGSNLYPKVFQHDVLMPLQRMRETEQMMNIARGYKPKTIVEVGADKGGCVYHWIKCLSPTRVGCVEIRGVPYAADFRKAFPDVGIVAYEGSSRDRACVELMESIAPFDVLFIDGEKGDMYADFALYLPMMNKRSVVFIHDVNDSYGALAIDKVRRFHPAFNVEIVINTTESLEAMERKKTDNRTAFSEKLSSYEGWLRHWNGKSAGFGVVRIEKG